jgi:hypothetical protein
MLGLDIRDWQPGNSFFYIEACQLRDNLKSSLGRSEAWWGKIERTPKRDAPAAGRGFALPCRSAFRARGTALQSHPHRRTTDGGPWRARTAAADLEAAKAIDPNIKRHFASPGKGE